MKLCYLYIQLDWFVKDFTLKSFPFLSQPINLYTSFLLA